MSKTLDKLGYKSQTVEDQVQIALEQMDELNENELKTLVAMVNSSKGNGHDFGISEDLTEDRYPYSMILKGLSKKQIVGYISSLAKKGYVICDGLDSGMEDMSGRKLRASTFNLTKKGFKKLGMDENLAVR